MKDFLWKFQIIRILTQQTKSTVFTSKLLYKCFVLNWVLYGEIRACGGWGIQVSSIGELIKKTLLGIFGLPTLWCKAHKPTLLPAKLLLKLKKSWMPTLMEEIKLVILVKCEFEYREELKLNGSLGTFGLPGFWCMGKKQWIYSWILAYEFCLSQWDVYEENRSCCGWELKVWISIDVTKICNFWNICTVYILLYRSKQKIY